MDISAEEEAAAAAAAEPGNFTELVRGTRKIEQCADGRMQFGALASNEGQRRRAHQEWPANALFPQEHSSDLALIGLVEADSLNRHLGLLSVCDANR